MVRLIQGVSARPSVGGSQPHLTKDDLYQLLQGCLERKDLVAGRCTHSLMINSGLQSVAVLGDHLIRLFAACGSLHDANLVFCIIANPSPYTWHAIISAHAALGHDDRALYLYQQMQQDGLMPCKHIFSCVLKVCGTVGALRKGKLIHEQVIQNELEMNIVVGSAIVDMYAKCGSLEEAHIVFDTIPSRDVVLWNTIMYGYTQHGHSLLAFDLFVKMHQDGVKPSKVTFLCMLKACGSVGAIQQGRLLNEQILRSGLELDVVITSTLIDMYAKCGHLEEAHKVFEKLPNQSLVSWNALIAGYAQHGCGLRALEILERLHKKGITPDKVTCSSSLTACGNIGALLQGKLIHDQIIRMELDLDLISGNSLIDMYAKCGALEEGQKMLQLLPKRDAVAWGVMIEGYVQHGHSHSALDLFSRMHQEGVKPDKATYLCILKACSSFEAIMHGRLIHDQIIKSGLDTHEFVANTLIALHLKCGHLEDACKVFNAMSKKDATSWAVMIGGYAQHGQPSHALKLFERMQQDGVRPNKFIFLSVLKAYGTSEALWQGRLLHGQIITHQLQSDALIGSTLIDMYSKSGSLVEARKVFDELPTRNAVSCNIMIAGYIQHGECGLPVIKIFEEMFKEGIKPDRVTFLLMLKACGSVGASLQGKLIHEHIVRSGLELDIILGTSLVYMYIKCGSLDEAHKMFHGLSYKTSVSWNAFIAGFTEQGDWWMAGQTLAQMQCQGLKPNDRTYTSLLSACSHDGQMVKGCQYFNSMRENHGIVPCIEHFNGMVDMLGRAGHLEMAEELLQTMPVSPNISVWKSLLTACRLYGNMELGWQCFDEAFDLNSKLTGEYVLRHMNYVGPRCGSMMYPTAI